MIKRIQAIIAVPAAEDHSAKEGYFVKLDAAGKSTLVAAVTDTPCGVIVDSDGVTDSIAVPGGVSGAFLVKLAAGANVKAGDFLRLAADGSVGTEGEGPVVARALENGVADELIEAVVLPAIPSA